MTSSATYPRPTGRGDEVSVPQADAAVPLDLTVKTLKTHVDGKALMKFDSISDLVVSLGFEKSYGFLKSQKEKFASEPTATALFVVERNAQDEGLVNLIKRLFSHHLSYDASGLEVTRELSRLGRAPLQLLGGRVCVIRARKFHRKNPISASNHGASVQVVEIGRCNVF
jgi:hypothetical protein